MSDTSLPDGGNTKRPKKSSLRWGAIVFGNVVLPLAMAFGIVWAYNFLIDTAPVAKKQKRESQARLVEVMTTEVGSYPIEMEIFGSVRAASSVELKAEVSGAIEWVHPSQFEPGGHFKAGETILKIDPKDFEIQRDIAAHEIDRAVASLAILQGDLESAKASLAEEMGRQAVAKKEYELHGRSITDPEQLARMLRKPQLAKAQAQIAAVEARIENAQSEKAIAEKRKSKADLDTTRTDVKAPFDAILTKRSSNKGDMATGSKSLATLIESREVWMEVGIPSSALKWVKLPSANSGGGAKEYDGTRIKVINQRDWKESEFRDAEIMRLLPVKSEGGRQARLLIRVRDPFSLKTENKDRPKLLVGSFVRLQFMGQKAESVVRLPRAMLREGSRLWIANAEDKLQIRKVTPVYSGKEFVFVTSTELNAGERVIASALPSPVVGLHLRVRELAQEPAPKTP